MIGLLGDIALNGLICEDKANNKERFKNIRKVLSDCELSFANLETPIISSTEENEFKQFLRGTNKAVLLEILRTIELNCVSLANNHILDYKLSGLKSTIEILESQNIKYTGAGWLKKHIEPVVLESKGKRIGFCAYVDSNTNPKAEYINDILINMFDLDKVISDINKVKQNVDLLICSIHWGRDYSNFYSKTQQVQAKRILIAGADIIMGHHSHTLQTFDYFNNKPVFYSLGQVCFGDFLWEDKLRALRRKTKIGLIAKLDYSGNVVKLIPTKELKGNYIIIPEIKIEKVLNNLRWMNKMKMRFALIDLVIRIKESLNDRIAEFLFGYYRQPLREVFKIKNTKKVNFILRDFRKLEKNAK